MKRTRVAAAVAAAAALSLAPLASASAETPVVSDPTVEAQASLLAAAVITEEFAVLTGFHSTVRVSDVDRYSMKVEAWTDPFSRTAAVRYRASGGVFGTRTGFSGSVADWTAGGGPVLTAWAQINPEKTKADQKVMRELPKGAKYVTGRAPADSGPSWGFTARQVTANLSNSGYLPWNVASLIAWCGDSDEMYSVTCNGSVETVSGKEKVWRFTVFQKLEESEWTTDIVAKSNAQGVLNFVEYTAPDSTARTVVKIAIGENTPTVPTPDLYMGNTIASRTLTQAAASVDAKIIVRNFRSSVETVLAESGKKVNAKNVHWAYERLVSEGMWFYGNASQWSSGLYAFTGVGYYDFGALASDNISTSTRYAIVKVKNGKMYTTFSNKPTVYSDSPVMTPRAESVDSTPVSPPWAQPTR